MTPRERRTISIGLGVVVVAVTLNLLVRPVFASWQEARTALADHDRRLESLELRLDRRDTKQRQLAQKHGPAVGQPLPSVAVARVKFPETVQAVLNSGGMSVSSMSLQGVRRMREVAGVSLVTLRVDGETSGARLADVLAALRGSELLALVEDVRLEKGGDNGRGEGPSYQMTLVLATPALTEGGS